MSTECSPKLSVRRRLEFSESPSPLELEHDLARRLRRVGDEHAQRLRNCYGWDVEMDRPCSSDAGGPYRGRLEAGHKLPSFYSAATCRRLLDSYSSGRIGRSNSTPSSLRSFEGNSVRNGDEANKAQEKNKESNTMPIDAARIPISATAAAAEEIHTRSNVK